MKAKIAWLRLVQGVVIDWDTQPSLSSRFRPARRGSIRIGAETLISFKTLIFTRDLVTGEDRPVSIGTRCFIGGGCMVMPGVAVGDGSIVGSGAVVFEDVPPGSIAVGNPAQVLRSGVQAQRFGRLVP
jgi:maltose O-acetyltransferase